MQKRTVHDKLDVIFEHATGAQEKVRMSSSLLLAILPRLLEPGWPYIETIIDGRHLRNVCKALNVFVDSEGKEVVL